MVRKNKKTKKTKDLDLKIQINKKDTVGLFKKRPVEIESKKHKKKYINKDNKKIYEI